MSAIEPNNQLVRWAPPLRLLDSDSGRPRKQLRIEYITESDPESVEREDEDLSYDPTIFPEFAQDHAKEVDRRLEGKPYVLSEHEPRRVLISDLPQFILAGKLCNDIVDTVSASLNELPHQNHVLRVLNEAKLQPESAEKMIGLQGASGAGQSSNIPIVSRYTDHHT